jgi:hypothetical protein
MFRPLQPPTRRRGAALIVVPALLGLFALIALSFVFYADSEATGSRLYREREARPEIGAPSAEDALNTFLQHLIYGPPDPHKMVTTANPGYQVTPTDAASLLSALRGHDFATSMYGWSGTGSVTAGVGPAAVTTLLHTTPFNGPGLAHERAQGGNWTIFALPNNPATGQPFDGAQFVNKTPMLWRGQGGNNRTLLLDPEYAGGPRTTNGPTTLNTSPDLNTNTGTHFYIGKNAPYTYPDLNNLYMASVSPTTGEVLVKSFHRDWLFDLTPPNTIVGTAGNNDWLDGVGRLKLLRPRPVDQLTTADLQKYGVNIPIPLPAQLNAGQRNQLNNVIQQMQAAGDLLPYPTVNADNTVTGDVQNMMGHVGVQRNDSIFMDVGMAPILWNGKLVKPLVAVLITDTEGRVNLSAHGNARRTATQTRHDSYAGYGPWEVNPNWVFDLGGAAATEGRTVVTSRFQNSGTVGNVATRNGLASRYYEPIPSNSPPTTLSPVAPSYSDVQWGWYSNPAAGPNAIQAPNAALPLLGAAVQPPNFGASNNPLQVGPAFGGRNFFTNNNINLAAPQTAYTRQATGHPSLFSPTEWSDRNAVSAANRGRTYQLTDLKLFGNRYAEVPDVISSNNANNIGLASQAQRTLGAFNAGAFVAYPTQNATNNYRLDAAHAHRLLVTPRGAVLDVPGLMPNYVKVTPGQNPIPLALTLTTSVGAAATSYPPRNPQGRLTNQEIMITSPTGGRFPDPRVSTPVTGSDFALRRGSSGSTDKDWRNARGALGPIDLNRPLTDYRTDPNSALGRPSAVNPADSTNSLNYAQAWADRHNLAKDIFARLILATGAAADVDPATGTIRLPQPVGATFILPSTTPGVQPLTGLTQSHMDALRYLAQVAVNIVDYIDNDDISTAFMWNPGLTTTGLTDLTAATIQQTFATSTTLATAGNVVFGVERPRLVINETYSEITNSPSEQLNAPPAAPGTFQPPSQPAKVRFWVELLNPSANPYPTAGGPAANPAVMGPLGDGSTPLFLTSTALGQVNPYKLVMVRGNKTTGAPGALPLPNYLASLANSRGDLPTGMNADAEYKFNGTEVTGAANKQRVGPNGGATAAAAYDPKGVAYVAGWPLPNATAPLSPQGIVVVGPKLDPTGMMTGPASIEFNPANTAPQPWATGMIAAPEQAAGGAGAVPQGMSYEISPVPNAPTGANPTAAQLGGANFQRSIVLLRRLANPYLPFNVPPTDPQSVPTVPFNPNAPYNPYVTVDYMDYVRTFDAVNRAGGPTPITQSQRAKGTGNSQGGYDPMDAGNVQRWSVGKIQPYAGFAQLPPPGGGGVVGAASFTALTQSLPYSAVIKQNPRIPLPNQPLNTFGRHNGQDAAFTLAAPSSYQTFPPFAGGGPNANPTYEPLQQMKGQETLMAPFDWLVHMDRKLQNQLELMHVQAVAPHRVTQLFLYPTQITGAGGAAVTPAMVRDTGLVPWFWPTADPNNPGNANFEPHPWSGTQVNAVFPNVTNGQTDHGLFRALDLLRVRPYGYGVPLAGKVHGKVNINTIQDRRLLLALLDPPTFNNAATANGNRFTDQDVDNLWATLMGSRTPLIDTGLNQNNAHQMANGTVAAGGVPIPGKTYDDDPWGNAATDTFNAQRGPRYGTTVRAFDRPFKPFGASEFQAPGGINSGQITAGGGSAIPTVLGPQFGPGLNDTLLRLARDRSNPTNIVGQAISGTQTNFTPQLWLQANGVINNPATGLQSSNTAVAVPYLRSEAARKLLNNVTTVSGTFEVHITVAFFEVRMNGTTPLTRTEGVVVIPPPPGSPPNTQTQTVNVDRYLLGKEAYREIPGDLRRKYFAVVDRNNLALDPADLTGRTQSRMRPFFTTLETAPFSVQPNPMAAPIWQMQVAASGFTNGYAQIFSDGVESGIGTSTYQLTTTTAGKTGWVTNTLLVGVGAEQEQLTVTAVTYSGATGLATLTLAAAPTKKHAAGTMVTNVRLGNPGPPDDTVTSTLAGFGTVTNVRDVFNDPRYRAIIPYLSDHWSSELDP